MRSKSRPLRVYIDINKNERETLRDNPNNVSQRTCLLEGHELNQIMTRDKRSVYESLAEQQGVSLPILLINALDNLIETNAMCYEK